MKQKAPSRTKTYQNVKKEIELWVKENSETPVDYCKWYCGTTNNPKIKVSQQGNRITGGPHFFKAWYMKSLRLSKALETTMHNIGMLSKDEEVLAKSNSCYIYVFKETPTLLNRLFG